ncbi:MAG: PAS domain-containing protein, partial [Holophagales bacterium]|nr:PAS domain-containing protein [Holophagales bacterium]
MVIPPSETPATATESAAEQTPRRTLADLPRHQRELADNLLDMAHVIVLTLDPEGRILGYSRALEELSGRPLEEMRGADWFDGFLPAGDRERIREIFADALDG